MIDAHPNWHVFDGVADQYDASRPSPPAELTDALVRLADGPALDLVVDLGCGSGHSTWIWANQAGRVIGIDPSKDMLSAAAQKTRLEPGGGRLVFLRGEAAQTGLAGGCADLVTCAQSFHWMEPQSTLVEVVRILKPGGVFAAYDYTWPPLVGWAAELAFEQFIERAWAVKRTRGLTDKFQMWPENRTLRVLQESGHFRYTREFWLHHQVMGNAERFVELALSNGLIQDLRAGLVSAEEVGLDDFKKTAQLLLGGGHSTWFLSYHVRVGIL